MAHERQYRTTPEIRQSIVTDSSGLALPYLDNFSIAKHEGPEKLAGLVRQKFIKDAGALAIVESIVEFYDWGLKDMAPMGSIQSLLMPLLSGGFTIIINTSYDYGVNEEDARAALITHELAHTYFYTCDTTPPKRRTPAHTPEEENFCDSFALELTGFDLSQ